MVSPIVAPFSIGRVDETDYGRMVNPASSFHSMRNHFWNDSMDDDRLPWGLPSKSKASKTKLQKQNFKGKTSKAKLQKQNFKSKTSKAKLQKQKLDAEDAEKRRAAEDYNYF
jgi:hypothetical protein